MRDYLSIFDEVVEIIENDYAGKDEKIAWGKPEKFRNLLNAHIASNSLNDEVFYDLVEDYLADYKDGHIIWLANARVSKNCGFKVRRFENALYVTEVLVEAVEVNKGWRIVEIDGVDIEAIGKEKLSKLKSNITERQRWNGVISNASTLTFQLANGEKFKYTVKDYTVGRKEPKYEMRMLKNNILYMRFEDFADPDAIAELVKYNKHLIDETPYWIIDVRNNAGGMDYSYYPLLPYIFSAGEKRKEDILYYLMTERNCDTRIALLNAYSANLESKDEIEKDIRMMEENRGRGFVRIESESNGEMAFFNETKLNPKHIVIMSDTYCGSSGDQFIYEAKGAKKVTVIGRATAGVLDYSNLTSVTFSDAFQLMYPISKRENVINNSLTYNGIEPDIYLPWTPENINDDLDLKEALKIIALYT